MIKERYRPEEEMTYNLLDLVTQQVGQREAQLKALAKEEANLVREGCQEAAEWLQTVTGGPIRVPIVDEWDGEEGRCSRG